MSSHSILVIGATGKTGSSTVEHLSQLISSSSSSSTLPGRIIALTRDTNSAASQKLAHLDHVEVKGKDWTSIDGAWLIEAKVSRVYLASHNFPNQFIDESKCLIACRDAKIEYLVKLSTLTEQVTPDHSVYYGRAHWAVENLLEQNQFKQLNWTVLRANYFMNDQLLPSLNWLKENKTNDPLPLFLDEEAPVALINPQDVGEAVAKLLSLDDPSPHFKKKYNLSGPEDVRGKDVVAIIEQMTNQKFKVDYRNITLFRFLIKQVGYPENALESVESGLRTNSWLGLSQLSKSPTSPEMLKLAPPHSTVKEFIQQALNQ